MASLLVVHDIAGRLRLRLPPGAKSAGVEDALRQRPGVVACAWSPLTRSLLVHYRPGATTSQALIDVIAAQAGLSPGTGDDGAPAPPARPTAASTVAFSTLTTAQLLHALGCRSETRSGLSELQRSPALVSAVGGTLALQVAAVTVPALRRLLGTAPLAAADWGIVAGGAVLPLVVTELTKVLRGRGPEAGSGVMRTERRPSWQPSG